MLHQFTVKVPLNLVEEAIEKLNIHGYYNTFYDQPMEEVEVNYIIDLHIILEDDINPEKIQKDIKSILNTEKILYQLIENNW